MHVSAHIGMLHMSPCSMLWCYCCCGGITKDIFCLFPSRIVIHTLFLVAVPKVDLMLVAETDFSTMLGFHANLRKTKTKKSKTRHRNRKQEKYKRNNSSK